MTCSKKEREKEFSPFKIRTALDEKDGFTEKKRAAAYKLLCELAGHATPEGFVMLVPDRSKSTVHCGPFFEITALQAVLSEAAKLALQAAQAFRGVIKNRNIVQREVLIDFMQIEDEWLSRFFDTPSKSAEIVELRALLESTKRKEAS
jgi:hypothetical protein